MEYKRQNTTQERGERKMSGWRKDNEIYLSVKVDRQGMLGKITKIVLIEDELRREIETLQRMLNEA